MSVLSGPRRNCGSGSGRDPTTRCTAGVRPGRVRPGRNWWPCWTEDAPLFSLSGPSRLGGLGILPEDVHDLFAADWEIETVPTANPAERAACYWMTRRGRIPGQGGSP